MIRLLLSMPPPELSDIVPVSEELVAEAYRDLVVEMRAERLAMRALVWVVVIWIGSYPLDRILGSIGRLIIIIRSKRPQPQPHP